MTVSIDINFILEQTSPLQPAPSKQ